MTARPPLAAVTAASAPTMTMTGRADGRQQHGYGRYCGHTCAHADRRPVAAAWSAIHRNAGNNPLRVSADLTIDIDSTVCETYGLAKQGATGFAYTGARGYHPLMASLGDTGELLATRLRGGTSASGRGAASFVAETISRVRHAGATGVLTLRADSGFYAGAVVSACRRHGVRYSITARKNTAIQRAIDAISDDAWVPIPYWLDGGADVADTVSPLAGTRHETTVRFIVRRVRPTPGSQVALEVVFGYHAILTETGRCSPWRPITVATRSSRTPSPTSSTTPAWRTCRRDGSPPTPPGSRSSASPTTSRAGPRPPADLGRVTTKTLRPTVIAVPARLVRSGRRSRLRLPTPWPWADHITAALDTIGRLEPAPG